MDVHDQKVDHTPEQPHPLALQLASDQAEGSILLVGIGSGRNLLPFVTPGFTPFGADSEQKFVIAARSRFRDVIPPQRLVISDEASLPFTTNFFHAALATHAFQHGTWSTVAGQLSEVARVVRPGGRLFASFGSTRDTRFGHGRRIDDACWAAVEGDEIGVPHLYCTREALSQLLAANWAVLSMVEESVDAVVGTWAHSRAHGMVHWFVKALRV